MDYFPDAWVVLKINTPSTTIYKVLAGWFGDYLTGDSWRINSGITTVHKEGECFIFGGASGSDYICHQDTYKLTNMTHAILEEFNSSIPSTASIEVMPEDTNWFELFKGN